MARFQAYTSDHSDKGSSSEQEVQEQHVDQGEEDEESDQESMGTLSSSDMQEEEFLTSPLRPYKRPNRNAVVEDEDVEIRYAHDVEGEQRLSVRVSSTSSSLSPLPPRNHGDLTMISWAQHVGIDAQKLRVMQASLFRIPEEADALQAMTRQTKPSLRVPLQPSHVKYSHDSDRNGLRFEPRGMNGTAYLTRVGFIRESEFFPLKRQAEENYR